MKINYLQILNKNMINVLKEVLQKIQQNNLKEGHHLYITFKTRNNNIILPKWLKKKYPDEMTIVIQHEYSNLKVLDDKFEILLSFENINVNLSIPFKSIISFADPYANFGLKLNSNNKKEVIKNKKNNNVIDFKKFKKLN